MNFAYIKCDCYLQLRGNTGFDRNPFYEQRVKEMDIPMGLFNQKAEYKDAFKKIKIGK